MIGRIKGKLIEKNITSILVDVGGIGYEIEVPLSTYYRLPEAGADVVLSTHFVVREDAQLLFGFLDGHERALFRSLIKVNGIGPKLGLTILSGMETNEFVQCIQNNDLDSLMRMPGVGKKTAERLVVEMRDRVTEWTISTDGEGESARTARDIVRDAETALTSLGFRSKDAARAIAKVDQTDIDVEVLIKEALRNLA